jgi:thiopurine S-methyltransferase
MESAFWHERWAKNEIGFHRREVHPYLQQFWPPHDIAPGSRVFVPLCGKSRDLLWLCEQGHEVVGVELSALAVDSFFAENALTATITQHKDFTLHQSGALRIYCGDFFKLGADELNGVSAVFDRAALVALPPAMRQAYAAHLQKILPPRTITLLVNFEYPQEQMQGPPFSVPESEIRALFEPVAEVSCLHEQDILAQEPRFVAKGLTRLREQAFYLHYR